MRNPFHGAAGKRLLAIGCWTKSSWTIKGAIELPGEVGSGSIHESTARTTQRVRVDRHPGVQVGGTLHHTDPARLTGHRCLETAVSHTGGSGDAGWRHWTVPA